MHSYSNKKNETNYSPAARNNEGNYLHDNRRPLQAKAVKGSNDGGVVQRMLKRTVFSHNTSKTGNAIIRRFHHHIQGGGANAPINTNEPVPIPPNEVQQIANPNAHALVPFQHPQNAVVPYQPPIEDTAPQRQRKPKKIINFIFKPGSFTSEMFAGLRGYITHYFFGPYIVVISPTDQARIYFDIQLHRMLNQGIVPRWCHQLIFQNASQAKSGNKLPMEAAIYMINALEALGRAAMANEKRTKLLSLYLKFQLGSVPYFLAGGSSYAPAVMHFLGMMLQSMPILLLGRRWVLRPAKGPALRGINLEKAAIKDNEEGKTPKK